MTECPTIILRPEKQGTFLARHPWVLGKSLARVPQELRAGDEVDLVSPDGRFVARGLFNSRSRIQVRLYSWTERTPLDARFWHRLLSQAIGLRRQLGLIGPQRAARLIFSEADGLSGLIVDQYDEYLVVQLTAAAMHQRLDIVLPWLIQALQPRGIQLRVEPRIAKAEGIDAEESWVHGSPPVDPVEVLEHGVRLQVDLGDSQKTGCYLDQRDNRARAAEFFRGRTLLDVCCYTGGFALAALRAGAQHATAIDASQRAIEQARQQAALNQFTQIDFMVSDCFEGLERMSHEPRRFGGLVLDPPRFAGSRRALSQALQAYHRLNRLAMNLLEPGGILVTCSCSGLVSRDDFRHMLVGASRKARRNLQILEQRGAAADHPVWLSCPETEYLKCFICRVL